MFTCSEIGITSFRLSDSAAAKASTSTGDLSLKLRKMERGKGHEKHGSSFIICKYFSIPKVLFTFYFFFQCNYMDNMNLLTNKIYEKQFNQYNKRFEKINIRK